MLEYVGITLSTWDLRFFLEDPPHRQHMVFLGASIMADAYEQQAREGSLIGVHALHRILFGPWQANSRFWISRQEYQDGGAGGPDTPCQQDMT